MSEWNCPVNGDWSQVNFNEQPWVAGIADLTHEQVLFVQERLEIVKAGYVPAYGEPQEPSDFYVQSEYNKLVNFEQAINGETYFCIKGYDPSIHTLGINENGIILPPQEPEGEIIPEEGE